MYEVEVQKKNRSLKMLNWLLKYPGNNKNIIYTQLDGTGRKNLSEIMTKTN